MAVFLIANCSYYLERFRQDRKHQGIQPRSSKVRKQYFEDHQAQATALGRGSASPDWPSQAFLGIPVYIHRRFLS